MSVLICAGDWNIRREIPPSDPVLSVRPDLTSHILLMFTFAGSSHNKYTSYLLDTIAFLEIDAGPELRDMFLRNWLVNLSGEAGRYLEKDLMQEHHNDILEGRIKRSGMEWDSKQMRDTHSRMVHHTERIKKEMWSTVALSPKGWKHPKPHD